ncbi:hypothetical protein F2P81_018969 [Scophthalmus maximus]|uniref:Uncharacterized protein n=1 Tax=Scophthalmus maximus TaxID=52904 RepID=A0A6A4SG20_SCOMX|nr:hypothetical protein F2P81_018969 [Scophthalmus maximus]
MCRDVMTSCDVARRGADKGRSAEREVGELPTNVEVNARPAVSIGVYLLVRGISDLNVSPLSKLNDVSVLFTVHFLTQTFLK